jgi:HK97 family phage portal protein
VSLLNWVARKIGLTDSAGWGRAYPASSAAGKTVTIDTAMQLATVWACVRLLSETIGTLPMLVYRKDNTGARSLATDHTLYGLLHESPHADFTAVEFWEGIVLGLCLGGNAYAEKEWIGNRLVALNPLRSDMMEVSRNRNNEREYRYHDVKGVRTLSEDDVFHVRGFGPAGDLGLSPISFARHSLGAAMAADETASKMFANGVRPTGILTIDQVLKPEQRKSLKENVVEPMAGSANAGGLFLLEAGMKFQPVTLTPEDAQFLQTRGFHVEEICRWFRVPPFMVGHTEKTTSWGSGLEQQMIGFLTFSLRPYLSRIEQAVRRSLIPAKERPTLFAEFKVEGLLRADSVARGQFFATMVQNGIYTRNEVRALENMPPKPNGEELTVQSQNVALGAPPPRAPSSTSPN